MTAAEALEAARAVGVRVDTDGPDLLLDAEAAPPDAVLDALKRHKAKIVVLIRSGTQAWSREDWRAFFEERAAVAAVVGGLSRPHAEAQALEWCIVEWMTQNPETSDPGQCAWCRGRDASGSAILPFGRDATGHAWLHGRCWDHWYREKRQRVVRALVCLGVKVPGSVHESASAPPCLLNLPDDLGKSGGS
jgi:hypothetical protein